MKTRMVLGLALAAALCSAQANAQQDPIAQVPMYNWNYQHHASTADEGYLRGAASVAQATGQQNYSNSLAAVNFAEAYRRQLENSRLYVQVYLERREMVRAYLNKYGNHPPTREQLERVAVSALPDRLSAEEYDPVSGKLVWPHVLRDDAYTPFRNRVDQLISVRTPENSGDGSAWQRDLSQVVDSMKRVLKQNIDTVTPQQYARAKWFLMSLDYEGRLLPGAPAPGGQGQAVANTPVGAPAPAVNVSADVTPPIPAPATAAPAPATAPAANPPATAPVVTDQ
jgi:hypothetical protein